MVNWTEPAKNDLRRIYDYIAFDSVYYAKNVVRTIVSKTKILEKYSELGRVVPELETQEIREIFVYSYRIIYEIKKRNIEILTVIHGKRDFESTDFFKLKYED